MPEIQKPVADLTLSVRAARTLSSPTRTAPQMLALSPRGLLHLLPWVNVQGGTYQVTRRRIVLKQGDRGVAGLRFEERHNANETLSGEGDPGSKLYVRAARWTRLTVAVALALVAGACSSKPDISLPTLPPPAGQLAAGAPLEESRGLILARIDVVTDGEQGFGPISNRLVLQFQAADDPIGSLEPLDPDAHIWTSAAQRPSQWQYQSKGLLAMSVVPDTYGSLLIAYPDHGHNTAAPSSIPEPSAPLTFTPLTVPAGEIVYVGDIEIRQDASLWNQLLSRVDVSYVVHDDYDRTVADFRARYPQFADVEVQKKIAQVN